MLALLALSMTLTADDSADAQREYYSLITYENDDADRGAKVASLIDESIAPIVRQFDGVTKVGVFTETQQQPKDAEATGNVYLLVAADDVRTASTITDKLTGSDEAQQAFRSVDWPISKKADVRTYWAFSDIPQVELPRETVAGEDRVFEMRTYYSASPKLAQLKVEMFDEGETQLMRDVNLQPVFYGSALVGGEETPHLAYLLAAPSIADHKVNWQAFLDSPVWDKMKKNPRYKGTVSKIESVFLQPTPGSDI